MNNIIFCGFGELGKKCLIELEARGYKIEYVLTHEENKNDSVDTYSEQRGIKYSYLDSRKNIEEISGKIKTIKPEFLVSVNYRYIIPEEIYKLARFAINVHGSLLPKYRGRTPHVWSIINGEKESGVTCHIMGNNVDAGDIISQIKIPIEKNDTGYSLLKKFELNYPSIVIDSINKITNGVNLVKQDENLASYYGKRTPDMGYIDFRRTGIEIINFIRAQAEPYPGAYYYLVDGRRIIINKIAKCEWNNLDIPIGVIKIINNQYVVRCKDCLLKLEEYRIN